MVAHAAAERHEIDVAGGSGAEAQIDVFAAVDVRGVETAQFFPERAPEHNAGASDSDHPAVARREERPARAVRQRRNVLGFAFEVDFDAGVIDDAGGGV